LRAPDPNPLPVPGGATCRSSAKALTTKANLLPRTGVRVGADVFPFIVCSSLVGPFVHPCTRPASASQAREPDSPSGLRPLRHPVAIGARLPPHWPHPPWRPSSLGAPASSHFAASPSRRFAL
jgi:hypothetical protein